MKFAPVMKKHLERITESTKDKNLTAQRYAQEVKRMASSVEALERLAVSRNPKDTEESHTVKVAAAAKRLASDAAKTNDRLHDTLKNSVITIEAKIREQAGMLPNQYATEIRQAFRSMTQQQRGEALQTALKNGDSATIAAIADAPEIVTGIQTEFRDRMVESLQRQKAPELYAELDDVYESFSTSLAALGTVDKAISSGFDPAKLAEIEAAEAKHNDASNALTSSMIEPA